MAQILLEGRIKITTFRPPRGFDPLASNAAEAVRYGFPTPPEEPRHRERYRHVWNQIKDKFHYIEPSFRLNGDRLHGPRRRPSAAGAQASTNWSGGVVFAPAGRSFKWIEGDWVIPNIDAPSTNQWYYCANWIGLDGDGSGDVCQAGVECDVFRCGNTLAHAYYPWWEWFPLAEVQITNFPIEPGDLVSVLLCTSGADATAASVFFANRTTGAATSFAFNAPEGTRLVGNSAEWVVEAPTVDGAPGALADYGEVFFSVCEAFLTDNTTVAGGTGDAISLTVGGTTLSDGALISPTVIQCLYAGTAPSDAL
ncbi:MAG TPA: G1 family glutamic endopeptidase [Stellaceae bacterium]|nr:G1 family glutamic endopeptidase [Stellaceae bacterium]